MAVAETTDEPLQRSSDQLSICTNRYRGPPARVHTGISSAEQTMTSSRPSPSLPAFITEEQVRRQAERRQTFEAMQSLTRQGRHREAAELWNTMIQADQAA